MGSINDKVPKIEEQKARETDVDARAMETTLPPSGSSSDTDAAFAETIAPSSNQVNSDEMTAVSDLTQEFATPGATQDFTFEDGATKDFTPIANARVYVKPKVIKRIGHYEIEQILGRGGMGVVYKARDSKLDRIVALKMILAGSHASVDQLNRFITEAKAVAHLQHPNIVQIFEVDEHDELPFFSLEFVDGMSLDKKLAGTPLPPMESARLLETISRAMQYAHDHGILHRDLKPANILLSSESAPKITDFGLAKRLEEDNESGSTRTGTVMGTASYMSPEQASGNVHSVGPAADQYSLGAMLYEFITGRPPFMAAKAVDTILQVLYEEPVPPRQLQAKLPVDLETICLKALQKDPEKRYASCAALADDLARFVRGEPIVARPVGNVERVWRWCKRNPVVAGLMATAAVSILAVAIVSTWSAVTVANKNAELANTNNALNSANESLTKTNEDLQEANDENVRRSKRLQGYIQQVFTETSLLDIQQNPKAKAYKNKLLTDSLPIIDEIRKELPKGEQAEATMMNALQQLGKFYADQEKTIEAEKARTMLVEMARGRMVVTGGSDKARQNLANALFDLSETRAEMNRNIESSTELLNEALEISKSIIESPKAAPNGMGLNPPYMSKWLLANCHFKFGLLLYRKGNSRAAEPHFAEAIALQEEVVKSFKDGSAFENMPKSNVELTEASKKRELLQVENGIQLGMLALSNAKYRTNRVEEAEPQFRELVQKAGEELKANAGNPVVIRKSIGTLGFWGEFLCQTGREEPGLVALRRGAELSDEMLKLSNESTDLNRAAATAYYRLAQWLSKSDKAAAEEFGKKSLEIRQTMAKSEPTNDRRQSALMASLSRFGDIAEAVSIADRYSNSEHKDSEMLMEVAQALAQCSARSEGEQAAQLTEKALQSVKMAIGLGFCDEGTLERDIDLAPLRTAPEFQSMLAEIKSRLAVQ